MIGDLSNQGPRARWQTLAPHVLTMLVAAAIAATAVLAEGSPGASTSDGPAERALAASLGVHVIPGSVVWPAGPPGSDLRAASEWHEVLFLAAAGPGQPSDLYRAEARITAGGGIAAIGGLRNLTTSPVGDDFALSASPPHVAVATRAIGQVRSLTVFDLNPEQQPRSGEGWTPVTRFLARLTDLAETGRLEGIGRTTLRFTHPPDTVDLAFVGDGEELRVGWTDRLGRSREALVNASDGQTSDEALIAQPQVRLPKRPILWLVDTVRSWSWVGPGPIEWAEGRFFGLRDSLRRLTYRLGGDEDDQEGADPVGEAEALPALDLPPGHEIGAHLLEDNWPPQPLSAPVFSKLRTGEGQWVPAIPDFVETLPNAPPAVYRSFIRPDLERPYVRVQLLAMDMRQLELHMVAGYEDPRSTTGSQGTGRFPRRPALLPRVIAAFNGAFKTEHGEYGMMVERDVLLPPQDSGATAATLSDGRALLGTWPPGQQIPEEMISYRQNMDPLVENGVVNPRRRYLWGFTLDEDITQMNTIRSGICRTKTGSLIYAWGEDLTGKTLGIAMNAAGCDYGIHLDMNPFHTSYAFYKFSLGPDDDLDYKSKLAIREMRFSPRRYVNGAPKDFFFLALRDVTPGPGWSAEGLAQCAPAFVPCAFRRQSGDATLIAVDLSRASTRLLPGEVPAELAPATSGKDSADDLAETLVHLPLGPWSSGRGQSVQGTVVAALEPDDGTLAVDEHGRLEIGNWAASTCAATGDAVVGQWLSGPGGCSGEVALVARWREDWLLLGSGSLADLEAALTGLEGVGEPLVFPSCDPAMIVRGPEGMVDIQGRPVSTLDPAPASLRVVARPRPLGAERLEHFFDGDVK